MRLSGAGIGCDGRIEEEEEEEELSELKPLGGAGTAEVMTASASGL